MADVVSVYRLTMDIKKPTSHIVTPVIVQYDNVRLEVTVLDDGKPFDLTNVTDIEFVHKRPDLEVIVEPGTLEDGKIVYRYVGNEMDIPGNIKTSFSMINGDEKVSVRDFYVVVTQDLKESQYIPGAPKVDRLQELIVSVEQLTERTEAIAEEAQTQGDYAKEQGDYAKEQGDYVTSQVPKLEDLEVQYAPRLGDVEQKIQNIEYMGKYLNERLGSGDPATIKIIGDSFTAGVGASGYYNDPPTPTDLIFIDPIDSTEYRESNYTNLSYSNLFRNFLATNYPSVTFKKWGIGGKSTKWWNARIQEVTNQEDIVMVLLGTNDRWDNATPEDFKNQLIEFLGYLRSISNAVIVMTPSPVSVAANNESNINFPQEEVNRVIHDVCSENGYALISHYDNVIDYSHKCGVELGSLLYDSVHPNDLGYDLIWRRIQSSLELYDLASFLNVEKYNLRLLTKAPNNSRLNTSTPADFKINKITVNTVTSGNTTGFPENAAGVLFTDMTQGTPGFVSQEYHIYNSNRVYRRIWSSAAVWGNWELFSSAVIISATNSHNNSSVPNDFSPGKITHTVIATANANGFPKNRAGILITDRTIADNLYNFQIYKTYSNQFSYLRFWNGTTWSPWKQDTTLTDQETIVSVVGEVGAGLTKDVVLNTAQSVSQSNFPQINIIGVLPTGITFCYFLNPSGNIVTVRFHNTTATNVNVGNVAIKFAQIESY